MAVKDGRSLEETPTWAVAMVCFVLITISILIEHLIHLLAKWLSMRNKKPLYEAPEKIKSESMLLGFLSLLLTVGQVPISKICVSEKMGRSWHPCNQGQDPTKEDFDYTDDISQRHDTCADKGQIPMISTDGIHQLHVFIFVLAVFHVICCLITLALGRLKMRKWKAWEMETKTPEYQYEHDPDRLRFARDTSFGRRHMNFWSETPGLHWLICFLRQFVRSVPKVDYLTLRHGFIIAHLAPQTQTNFNFQNYIKRTLEEDFKVVVGISPPIWLFAVLFLLFNGWRSYMWLPFIPLIIILLVGTKLQVIITKMGLRFKERGEVVKGAPVVQPRDDLFWFNRPRLLLYLIQFVFFQNAFQLAFFAWSWWQFGMQSCFHQSRKDEVIRISMGVIIQILCSYVTLPLYALVTQMGSNMKPTIFNERVAKALHSWHQTARKQIRKNHHLGMGTPTSPSMPSTPHQVSPPPSLMPFEADSVESFQTNFCHITRPWKTGKDNDSLSLNKTLEHVKQDNEMQESSSHVDFQMGQIHLEIDEADFSFEKNITS